MKKENFWLSGFKYCEGSKTVRAFPQNYWIATVRDNKLIFDSWDAAIKGRYCKIYIWLLWKLGLIKPVKNHY